jgi:predicted metal-binding membrane protein
VAGAGMWVLMMAAMMLPTAAPMTATFAGLSRRRLDPITASSLTVLFVTGYLMTWMLFRVVAALAQQVLTAAGALAGVVLAWPLAGAVLIGAGIYQLTPTKDACLRRCRSPFGFLAAHWRDGPAGAAMLGVRHGLWCLGCCVPLMLVLFAVGVMSLVWMAVLTLLVLGEKTLPFGPTVARLSGLGLIVLGGWTLTPFSGVAP